MKEKSFAVVYRTLVLKFKRISRYKAMLGYILAVQLLIVNNEVTINNGKNGNFFKIRTIKAEILKDAVKIF